MVFSIFGAQPLTIVGITGLISLFNYTIYDIIKRYDVDLYPQFMTWVAIWAAIFHWIFAIFNTCDYMRYVTDFSSESFGAYVGIIYCSMFEIYFQGVDSALLTPNSQGCGAFDCRIRGGRAFERLCECRDCITIFLHSIRVGTGRQRHMVQARCPWFSRRLRLPGELPSSTLTR